MDEGVRRVGTVIVRIAALFLSIFLFAAHGVTTGQTKPRQIHVFVPLADNQHQRIVPVPATLGNRDDLARNLYWRKAVDAYRGSEIKQALTDFFAQLQAYQIRSRSFIR
jgi:hypothetical protein